MAKVNFVLVSQPRSGSTWVLDTLSSHAQVFCDNELFNLAEIARLNSEHNTHLPADIVYRDSDPVRFYREFFDSEFAREFHAIGFNFMLGHHPDVLAEIIDNDETKIIFLERENKLAQASSWYRALQERRWATRHDHEVDLDRKLKYGRRQYAEYFRLVQTLDYLFKAATRDRDNVLHIRYADLGSPAELVSRMAGFLGVADKFAHSELLKQNRNEILKRFSNPRIVRRHMKALNLSHWLGKEI